VLTAKNAVTGYCPVRVLNDGGGGVGWPGGLTQATLTVGSLVSHVIKVTAQLKNQDGVNLAVRGAVTVYLSDDANGDSIIATAPSGGWAIDTNGVLIPLIANKAGQLISEANGLADINVTHTGVKSCYLIVVLPNGTLVASTVLTFGA
jgi:hypothetical protein